MNSLGELSSVLSGVLSVASRLQEYLRETECKINGERLDVAWRRVAASVPQEVFEVQVSGNLYFAVGKFKKAHLLWNSQPFLGSEEMRNQRRTICWRAHSTKLRKSDSR